MNPCRFISSPLACPVKQLWLLKYSTRLTAQVSQHSNWVSSAAGSPGIKRFTSKLIRTVLRGALEGSLALLSALQLESLASPVWAKQKVATLSVKFNALNSSPRPTINLFPPFFQRNPFYCRNSEGRTRETRSRLVYCWLIGVVVAILEGNLKFMEPRFLNWFFGTKTWLYSGNQGIIRSARGSSFSE